MESTASLRPYLKANRERQRVLNGGGATDDTAVGVSISRRHPEHAWRTGGEIGRCIELEKGALKH